MAPVALSIVIPAYDEEARIDGALRVTRAWLDARGLAAEVLVVDDGSRDATAALVEGHARSDARVRLIRLPRNRGKGAAVRAGVLEARGERVLFMDADLATPLEELPRLERALDEGADVAIGSRALGDSRILTRQHPLRETMGRGFNVLVRALLFDRLDGIRDTQCGFKLFTRPAAEALFRGSTLERFAFDVELLVLARGRFRVAQVPVAWRHVERSKVHPLLDSARMAWDLLRLRARHRRR